MTALPAVVLLRHRAWSVKSWEYQYKKISLILAGWLLFGFLIVIYGSFIEPRILVVNKTSYDLPHITKPIKIGIIADLQVGPYKKDAFVQRVVNKMLAQKPDIVVILGDQINNSDGDASEAVWLAPLAQLTKVIPTYAIHGNHEYGVSDGISYYDARFRLPDLSAQVKSSLEDLGVIYLTNDLKTIEINGQKINLFGGDSLWAQKLNLSPLLKRPAGFDTIALIHNPSAIYTAHTYDVDLMLSGHTHGGQVRLPFIGPIIKVSSDIPRAWHKGWVNYQELDMFVTSGAGETGARARLLTPPEIVILTVY